MSKIRSWLVALIREAVKAELAARDEAIERELRSLDVGPKGGGYDPKRAAHLRRIGAANPLPPWPATAYDGVDPVTRLGGQC